MMDLTSILCLNLRFYSNFDSTIKRKLKLNFDFHVFEI